MQNYFGAFYIGEIKSHSANTRVMPIKVGIVSIFTAFNFAVCLAREIHEMKGTRTLRVLQVAYIIGNSP